MEFKLVFFITLIWIPGLSALTVVSPKNPVAVGSNVTLSLNDSMRITVGSWLYGSGTVVFWYPGETVTGSSFNEGMSFNNYSYDLTLTSVTLSRSGLYVLENFKLPMSKGEFRLEVQDPVSNVSLNVSNTILVEFNDSVTFACSARGTPTWFSWQNGSSVVTAGGRVELRNNGQVLAINGITRYDQGPFSCIVSNNISREESTQINLNISYGPSNMTMTVFPEKMAYVSGSTISLSCSADSKPAASFYWTYNDVPFNFSGPNLTLKMITQNQTGNYSCVAKNVITLRNAAVTKTIRIVDPISSVVVNPIAGNPNENMNFSLTCDVVGPDDSIYWMKNGMYLLPDNRITFSSDNSTLNFNQLTVKDDGLYHCEASNAVSNMTSQDYNFMVNYGPTNTTASGPNVGAAGSNVTFRCSADSRPQSQFSWYFNSTKVAEGPVYVTGVLSINDMGQYTCMAFNNITGSSSNASVKLTIKYPPRDVYVYSNQKPILNQSFTLACNYKGDVDSIQWMKNGIYLLPNNSISFSNENSTLSFNQLTLGDDGKYHCEASNAVSNMISQAYNLMVNYGPFNTEMNAPTILESGSIVAFNCSADSHPQSQYIWFFNNSKVAEGPVYMTGALLPNNSGQYTCMAFNNITGGSNNASVTLTVIDSVTLSVSSSPLIPLASQNLQLFCNVNGVYSLQWLRNNQNFQPSKRVTVSEDNTTVIFKPLQTTDNGNYQCVATSRVKQHFSQPFSLVANYGPQSVQIFLRPGITTTLTCKAASDPPAVYQWFNENNTMVGNQSSIIVPIDFVLGRNYTCEAKNPLTNVTVYTSINATGAAIGVQASMLLTALLALLLPVLHECL